MTEAASPAQAPADESKPVPSPEAPATAKPNRRRRVVAFATVGLLLAILLGTVVYMMDTPDAKPFDDPVDAQTRSANTGLYATLLAAGIEDPFVDINQDRVYIVYVAPNATAPGNLSDAYQWFALGAAADAAPTTDRLHIFQYIEADPHVLWTVETEDVRAYARGDIDRATLRARIGVTTF